MLGAKFSEKRSFNHLEKKLAKNIFFSPWGPGPFSTTIHITILDLNYDIQISNLKRNET